MSPLRRRPRIAYSRFPASDDARSCRYRPLKRRIPGRDQQPIPAFAQATVFEHADQRSMQIIRGVFRTKKVQRAAPSLTKPSSNAAMLLVEYRRPLLFIEIEDFVC